MSGKCDVVCQTKFDVEHYNIQWRIENYSFMVIEKGEGIESPTFTTGENEVEWSLKFYPDGYAGGITDHSSALLILKSQEMMTVCFEIYILHNGRKVSAKKGKKLFKTSGSHRIFDIQIYFIPGCIENDVLVFNLDLDVVETISNSISSREKNSSDLNQVSEDFLNLFNSPVMSDFIISVKNRQFKVHKAILSARSPAFASIFSYFLKSFTGVYCKDVGPDAMESVLQYIYSGRCDKLEGMAAEILPVADRFGLEKLKLMCEEMLCFQLDLNNIVSMLCLADMRSACKLKEKCIDFICRNCKNILETSEWKKLSTSLNKDLAIEITSALIAKKLVLTHHIRS